MSRTIGVYIGESATDVGILRHDARGQRESAVFEYSSEWLARDERFPIEPSLRLVSGPQFRAKTSPDLIFHGVIADSEPDGWGRAVILRDRARQRADARQRGEATDSRTLSNLDFLLAVDDSSRVGALRFRDEQGTFQRAADRERRTTPPLVELAQLLAATRAVEKHEETAADLAYLRGRGTSLGGLRPKCSVRDDTGTLSIAKFPSVQDTRSVTKGEVLALSLARRAGVYAADAKLVSSDGIPVALITRFDRDRTGRLHYASAGTLLGVQRDGAEHAYTDIVDAIRVHGASAKEDIEELWRRIVFSVLITNVDDHLWNHGFLHVAGGLWRLAPAFDVNPFPDRAREPKTWISEETGPEATIGAAMSITAYCNIRQDRAKVIVSEVLGAVSAWRNAGRDLQMSAAELDQFADAFEHREIDAARKLIS